MRILPDYFRAKRKGEPWKDFPDPPTKKDKDSREMVGDTIIIYRLLKLQQGEKLAFDIINSLIQKVAILHLKITLPLIRKNQVLSKTPEDREQIFGDLVEKFPNADWELMETSMIAHKMRFGVKITRCRLVELVNKLGYPELSGVFCRGDKEYFETKQPEIEFQQPHNIGEQKDPHCTFYFNI